MARRSQHDWNQPIFSEEDVANTNHILVELIRKMFYKNNITYQHFFNKIEQHCYLHNIIDRGKISSQKNRLLRALTANTITWKCLEQIVLITFDLIITGITVECLHISEDKNIVESFSTKKNILPSLDEKK